MTESYVESMYSNPMFMFKWRATFARAQGVCEAGVFESLPRPEVLRILHHRFSRQQQTQRCLLVLFTPSAEHFLPAAVTSRMTRRSKV